MIRSHFTAAECAGWVSAVYAARDLWTAGFGGEQFSLGRAFYTHLEEGRSAAYFDDPASSDARVEASVPGLQRRMHALVEALVLGEVRQRRGWCGPGVHVFPARGEVATRGGVVHFDTQGLSAHHRAQRGAALTVIAMLQPPDEGGGLRIWDVRYEGQDDVDDEALSSASVLACSAPGDVVVIESYRLHQIQPFLGELDRISITLHAAEVSRGMWETWF
ncbi:MAG: hypothetical protein NVSMB47_00970 [Polyangiales bacterium]